MPDDAACTEGALQTAAAVAATAVLTVMAVVVARSDIAATRVARDAEVAAESN